MSQVTTELQTPLSHQSDTRIVTRRQMSDTQIVRLFILPTIILLIVMNIFPLDLQSVFELYQLFGYFR